MQIVIDILCWPFVAVGCLFIVTGAIGLLRLPDLYTRLHAASLTDTGGTMMIGVALLLQSIFVFGSAMAAVKVVLVVFFTLITAPTASHALAKTSLLSGLVPHDGLGGRLLESSEAATSIARSRKPRSGEIPASARTASAAVVEEPSAKGGTLPASDADHEGQV